MTLERLRLVNFQRWRRLEVGLGQITTIVGPTDCGKTAVIRSLRWLALNRPAGTTYVRCGAKGTRVELEVDGHSVVRRRGVRNLYLLDGEELAAFGTSVPDPIAQLLRVGEEGFQLQHAAPFWLGLNGGQFAKELNRIADLAVLDTAQTRANGETRRLRAAVLEKEEELTSARQEASSLAWVVMAQGAMRKLDTMLARVGELKQCGERLVGAVKALQFADERLEAKKKVLRRATRVVKLEARMARLEYRLAKLKEAEEELCRSQLALEKRECPNCGRQL